MPKKRSRSALFVFLFLLIYFLIVTFWLTGGLFFENFLMMRITEKALVFLGGFVVILFAVMIEKRVRF